MEIGIVMLETAFKTRLLTLAVNNYLVVVDSKIFLEEVGNLFPDIIRKTNVFPCKINTSFEQTFVIPKGADLVEDIKYVRIQIVIFLESSNFTTWYNISVYEKLLRTVSEYTVGLFH